MLDCEEWKENSSGSKYLNAALFKGKEFELKDLKTVVRGQCLLNVLRGINICGVWVALRFLGLSSAQFLKAVGNRPTQYGVSSAQYF